MCIPLLLIAGSSFCQIELDYSMFYDDGYTDTSYSCNNIIALEAGEFVIAGVNTHGQKVKSVDIFRLSDDADLLGYTNLFIENQTASYAKLPEGNDGTIWVVYQTKADRQDVRTRVVQLTNDLDTILREKTYDWYPGFELPEAVTVLDNKVLVAIKHSEVDSGELVSRLDLISIDPDNMEVDRQLSGAFPRVSNLNWNLGPNFMPVGENRLALSAQLPREQAGDNAIEIREFARTDLSLADEIVLTDLIDQPSQDIEYLPSVDAYGMTDGNFSLYLISRGDSSDVDTILAPEGAFSRFRNRIAVVDQTAFLIGRNVYRVDFDSVNLVTLLRDFDLSTDYAEVSASGERFMLTSESNRSGSAVGASFPIDTLEETVTIELVNERIRGGTLDYYGVHNFDPKGSTDFVFGLHQNRFVFEQLSALELIDGSDGSLKGRVISPHDFSFWSGGSGTVSIAPLVKAGETYMTVINEQSRILFFRFDENFDPLQPEEVGYGSTNFDPNLFFFREFIEVAPTSYGVIGSTVGVVNNSYQWYFFSADTNFVNKVQRRQESLSIYPFQRVQLVVDSTDGFFTAGALTEPGFTFSIGQEFAVSRYDSSGNTIYDSRLPLANNGHFIINELDLREDEKELLVSGVFLDSSFSWNGFYAIIAASSGDMLKFEVVRPTDDLEIVSYLSAFYRDDGDIVYVSQGSVSDGWKIQTTMLDSNYVELAKIDVMKSPSFAGTQNVFMIDTSLYVSGIVNDLSNEDSHAFLTKLNTSGMITSTQVVGHNLEINFSPNPTSDLLNVNWHQKFSGEFKLDLYDTSGRPLGTWKSYAQEGRIKYLLNLQDIPEGPYVLKLTTEEGMMSQVILKQ